MKQRKSTKSVTCPVCEKSVLKKGIVKESIYGVYLGDFSARICTKCGESFTDEKTMRAIENVAKKKGIWGLGRKTKITRSGNSLAVRIPKEIVHFLNLEEGKEAYIYPDNKRIIIE